MKKKFRLIKFMVIILPLSLILLYVFLPIGLRLTLLGFKEGDTHMFKAYEETYTIKTSDDRIEAIQVTQSSDSLGPLMFSYPTDQSRVFIETDGMSCDYALTEATLTCDGPSLSETDTQTLKDTIVYHYFVINESFNWTTIPKSQR